MDLDPEDQDIIKLLTKIKDAEAGYPEHLLAARRKSYLRQMAEIGMGIGVGRAISNAAKNGGASAASTSTVASTLIESALVVAILVEAGVTAYFYRDKLANLFKTVTTEPRVQEVTPAPVVTTSLEIQGAGPSPFIASTLPSTTISTSPSGTVIVQSSTSIPGVANENNPGINQANSTPAPNGNNGNHYGQTPKPVRTKEQTGNSDNNPVPNEKPTKAK